MKEKLILIAIALAHLVAVSHSAPTAIQDGALSSHNPTRTTPRALFPAPVQRAPAEEESCDANRCKKKCFAKDWYRDPKTCECRPCGRKGKTNAANTGCDPDPDYDKRKGKCPPGQVVDAAEGGQDDKTAKPVCIPDDQDLCREQGHVPTSRDKNDKALKDDIDCGRDADEKDKPKCKSNEYHYAQVWTDKDQKKKVKYTCRKTRKFGRDKKEKFDDVKKRKKADYDKKKKAEDEKKKKEEAERKKKEEEAKEKQEEKKKKEEEETNKKKSRMGQCLTIVPLSFSAGVTGFGYSTDFFDEEFVSGDYLMQFWPPDMPDVPEVDITTEEYMMKFLELVDKDDWITTYMGPGGKRSEDTKVTPSASTPNSAVMQVPHEKRFVQAIISAIEIGLTRLGPLIARLGVGGSRLVKLVKQGGVRLAKTGKSKKSKKEMENGAGVITRSKNWKNCLKGEKPGKKY